MNADQTPHCPPPPARVTVPMTARTFPLTGGGVVPVWLQADYDPADPYAVTLHFLDYPTQPVALGVSWVVARDVLWAASELGVRSGLADVVVEPVTGGEVALLLSSPDSRNQPHPVYLPHHRLSTFLRQTVELVPLGDEGGHSDMDAFIAECLGSAA